MTKRIVLLSALLCLTVTGVACGEDKNPRPGVNVKESTLCSAIADVACYNMFRCCTGAQIEGFLGLTQSITVEECRHDVKLICNENMTEVFWSVARSATLINAQAYENCLDAIIAPKEACFVHQSIVPWDGVCDPELLIQGLLGVGMACFYDHECLMNHYCAPDAKCRALPTLGQPCPQSICASGLYCNWQSGNCEALKGIGQECNGSDECAENLFCDFDQTVPSCQARLGIGAICAGDHECVSNYCVPGICGDGSACYSDDDCEGLCAGTTDTCYDQYDCEGNCVINTTYTCYEDYDCEYYDPLDSCDQPVCQRACSGTPACGELYRVIDYCESAQTLL